MFCIVQVGHSIDFYYRSEKVTTVAIQCYLLQLEDFYILEVYVPDVKGTQNIQDMNKLICVHNFDVNTKMCHTSNYIFYTLTLYFIRNSLSSMKYRLYLLLHRFKMTLCATYDFWHCSYLLCPS